MALSSFLKKIPFVFLAGSCRFVKKNIRFLKTGNPVNYICQKG